MKKKNKWKTKTKTKQTHIDTRTQMTNMSWREREKEKDKELPRFRSGSMWPLCIALHCFACAISFVEHSLRHSEMGEEGQAAAPVEISQNIVAPPITLFISIHYLCIIYFRCDKLMSFVFVRFCCPLFVSLFFFLPGIFSISIRFFFIFFCCFVLWITEENDNRYRDYDCESITCGKYELKRKTNHAWKWKWNEMCNMRIAIGLNGRKKKRKTEKMEAVTATAASATTTTASAQQHTLFSRLSPMQCVSIFI